MKGDALNPRMQEKDQQTIKVQSIIRFRKWEQMVLKDTFKQIQYSIKHQWYNFVNIQKIRKCAQNLDIGITKRTNHQLV